MMSARAETLQHRGSDATDAKEYPDETTPSRNTQHGAINWTVVVLCWWWEIGGAILSAVCMGLILIILAKADGMALEAWMLPIQPNSLISVFTTIGKSALMVPIAGCLSQLAWQHFASKPKSLDHIRVFDDASRGPWGAVELLVVIGKKGYLARMLAVATVLALGIEPFAQQILEFGNRDVEFPMLVAEIGTANTYKSLVFKGGEIRDDDVEGLSRHVTLDNDISNAILGVSTQPFYRCPVAANNCTYTAFTTLGVCGTVTDLAADAKLACEKGVANDTTCTFTWENKSSISLTLNKLKDPRNPTGERQHEVFTLRVEPSNTTAPTSLTMTAIRVHSHEVFNNILTGKPPEIELFRLHWYWCTQAYPWTNASAAHLLPGPATTTPLAPSGTDDNDEWLLLQSPMLANQFRMDLDTARTLWSYMGTTLSSHVYMNTGPSSAINNPLGYHIGTDEGACRAYLEMFRYTMDLRNMTANIATMLTNYIRSSTAGGDNAHASTMTGSAWGDETYIEVRWAWLVVPLGETLLAIVLLWATIISALRSGVPVLGSSPLGLLFHGLDRGATEGLRKAKSRRRMVNVAKGMEVRFTERDNGGLGFVPMDTSREKAPEVVCQSREEGKMELEKDVVVEAYEMVESPTWEKNRYMSAEGDLDAIHVRR